MQLKQRHHNNNPHLQTDESISLMNWFCDSIKPFLVSEPIWKWDAPFIDQLWNVIRQYCVSLVMIAMATSCDVVTNDASTPDNLADKEKAVDLDAFAHKRRSLAHRHILPCSTA